MKLKNIPASILALLKILARESGEELRTLLTRFALERLLFRLSVAKHRESFVLKGAFLFLAWEESVERPFRTGCQQDFPTHMPSGGAPSGSESRADWALKTRPR